MTKWCYFKKVTRWFLTSSIKNVILLNEVIWNSYNFFNLYKKSPCFSMSSFGYNCHFGKLLQVMKKALFNKILIGFKNRIRHTVVNGTIYTLKNTLVLADWVENLSGWITLLFRTYLYCQTLNSQISCWNMAKVKSV